MVSLIPKEKLQEGFDKCNKQIESLLKSSEMLYDENQFHLSLALSMLAIEESTKLGVIERHIQDNTDIDNSEWNEITRYGSHVKKLIKPLEDAKKHSKDWTFEKYLKLLDFATIQGYDVSHAKPYSEVRRSMSKQEIYEISQLNEVKKDCFYLNWQSKKGNWFSILTNATDNIKKAFAYVNLNIAKRSYYHAFSFHFYPKSVIMNKEVAEKMKNDPIEQKMLELDNMQHKSEFKKKLRLVNLFLTQHYFKT